jgi:integral membrane sensor domain MASE1/anti-sigma regulatory factor (Ser/Thr protein kinase)
MSEIAGQTGETTTDGAARQRWPTWLVVAVVVVAYTAGALLNFVAFSNDQTPVLLFLPAGVTLSALVLTERRRWPWILVAVGLTEALLDLTQGIGIALAGGFALANTAEPLVGALLLRRYIKGDVDLLRIRDLAAFLGCCVVAGPLVGGLVGGTTLAIYTDLPWIETFLPFWTGDATGVLTVGGSVLAWRHRGVLDRPALVRWALVLLATAAVTALAFWPDELPLFYLPIPLLFWIGFSQRLTLLAISGLVMTVTANLMTAAGHGPLAILPEPPPLRTASMQLFLAIAILGAWLLAIGVAERDSARSATSAERAARQRLNAIQSLTAQLAQAATTEAIAQAVVRDGIVLIAEHGMAGVVSSDGSHVLAWTTTDKPVGFGPRYRRIPLQAESPVTSAVRTDTLLIDHTPEAMQARFPELAPTYRALGLRSGLCVPISGGDGPPLGALAFGFTRGNAIDPDTVAFAEALASLTGQALRRARAYEHELDAAHQLQQALLPVLSTGPAGINISVDYRPADRTHDVGGDWYDVFELPGGRIGFAVGDVVGHHLAAAAAMARLQSAIRILAQSATGPAQVLEQLDDASTLISDSEMSTVGYADYDPATRRLRYACAGHLPPLLITGRHAEYLWEARSMPIGVQDGPRPQATRTVAEGSTFVWYTDGLVERRRRSLRAALDRLAAAAVGAGQQDPRALCRALLHRMSEGEPLQDDTVVLCVQFPGPSLPTPANNGAAKVGAPRPRDVASTMAADWRGSEDVMERPFELATLRRVRHELGDFLHGIGLPVERADLLVLAINEAMINAIMHGGGGGRLTARYTDGQLTVTVEDTQPSDPPNLPRTAPEPTAEAGRGLWLIVQTFDNVRFDAGSTGLRLVMDLRLVGVA